MKRKKPKRKKKPPKFQLKVGDCVEELSKAKSNYFSCVVTSPPYNVGKDYGNGFNDNQDPNEYLQGLEAMFYEVYRVMRSDGLFFLNVGNSHRKKDKLGILKAHLIAGKAIQCGFTGLEEIIWCKSISIQDKKTKEWESKGQFTPVKGKHRLNSLYEYVFVFAKDPEQAIFRREKLYIPYADKNNVGRYSDTDGRCIGDLWFLPYETTGATKKKSHPAEFPSELPKRCIKLTAPGPVLDPYMGGGSTGEAALRLGREFAGIDQNDDYVAIARKRLTEVLEKRFGEKK